MRASGALGRGSTATPPEKDAGDGGQGPVGSTSGDRPSTALVALLFGVIAALEAAADRQRTREPWRDAHSATDLVLEAAVERLSHDLTAADLARLAGGLRALARELGAERR